MDDTPRIRLLVCPGTLPSQGTSRMDFYNYRRSGRPRLTGEELLAAVPEIARVANVEVDEGNPHPVLTLDELCKLAAHVNELLKHSDMHGAVVVQGTNLLEETAYLLTLTVHSEKPVVITGAQRPFTALSSDAAVNLLDAVRVAAHRESWGKGAVVVANNEINCARDVTKTNTYRVQTFQSRGVGVLGYADADRIVYSRTPTRRHTTSSEFVIEDHGEGLPHVEVLYVYSGTRPGLANAACNLGAKGLVIAGVGAGALGSLTDECIDIAASGRAVVVRSSRVGSGRVVRDSGYHEPGMVAAGDLSPQKAAVLLSLALTRTTNADEVQRIFDEY
jgi:L-asparaginase